ncbi:LysE family translocator [Rosenbergiella australiborealis]|uniref:LysE family translocator n=1 Tax=Rosenbergiella australiborealis TaxID=1544696 RepID=A0ABS5T931_9GAMM|nr:LysE family translocator [Rosenbergiella australiborealis]MBT0727468.1 LysE family translocator [Rosenbergiella australiborealis]
MLDPSYISYVVVMSVTPGPNNVMLATSGVNYGLKRTLPMVLGIIAGCLVQLLFSILAFEQLLHWMAMIRIPLTLAGSGYLTWLAWKIFRSAAPQLTQASTPMSFMGAVFFQAVNPKAWLMCLNVALVYAADVPISWMLLSYGMMTLPCVIVWAMLGDKMSGLLQDANKRTVFNGVMSLTLLVTAGWMLIEVIMA